MEQLHTPLGKSYWDQTGAYQDQYQKLYDKLVPASGKADTVHGELIRAISRLSYEFCNNGNCNSVEYEYNTEYDTCYECGGDGEIDYGMDDVQTCDECCGSGELEEETCGDKHIAEYYDNMLTFLKEHLTNNKNVYLLEDFMLDENHHYGNYTFDDKQMDVYNRVADDVMFQVLTTENTDR